MTTAKRTSVRTSVLLIFKVIFALLGFAAIVTEIATLVERDQFDVVNFFSYFTVQSNLILTAVLLIGAFAIFANKNNRTLDLFRGAAAFYIIVTGVVFSTLLADLDPALLTAVPADNIILHYIMPIIGLLDWLVDRPKSKIQFKRALLWISYPVLYVVYSIVRGQIVGWYPYPFLNVSTNGFIPVLIIVVAIGLLGVLGAYIFSRTTRVKQR